MYLVKALKWCDATTNGAPTIWVMREKAVGSRYCYSASNIKEEELPECMADLCHEWAAPNRNVTLIE